MHCIFSIVETRNQIYVINKHHITASNSSVLVYYFILSINGEKVDIEVKSQVGSKLNDLRKEKVRRRKKTFPQK